MATNMTASIDRTVDDSAATLPVGLSLTGRTVKLVPLSPSHAEDLYECVGHPEQAHLWTYMAKGPFSDQASFTEFITDLSKSTDPIFYAIMDTHGKSIGFSSFLRIDLPNRVVEIGWLMFSPSLQRTTAATEAIYLMARAAFDDLNFRRLEWKCDNLNVPSQKAAERFMFRREGLFRQHMIVKGRNRDTAWFSILDTEWMVVRRTLERWLDPSNFDEAGKQRLAISNFKIPDEYLDVIGQLVV
ncbi:acyl-CoA N-acyltransferase [Penicillium taxi]|uniref:acyl-CoA N-acyltransferase n=1 Tax=Penicillium taxi TaxID=168475 RepID=UPI0025451E2E|nr:acyl-CoA N-acyltransferase [Penicillium taxi]KAJ5893224.1 acyl-CoA N-acyltransferase [Penicillium taxi]